MSPDSTDREDLPELLDDLEATLAELRSDLRQETDSDRRRERSIRRNRRNRSGSAPDLPRPPSVSELLGFTEQYTLPTLISMLEATIRALELLRGTLRLVDPDRSTFEAPTGSRGASRVSWLGTGAAGVGREAVSGVERALSELETALANSEVAEDRASSELLGEARDLSAEIRERLETAEEAVDQADRQQGVGSVGRQRAAESESAPDGVAIEVTDGDNAGAPDPAEDDREDRPEVDVEAELTSIKREVRGTGSDDPADGNGGAGDDGADEAQSGDGEGSAKPEDQEEP